MPFCLIPSLRSPRREQEGTVAGVFIEISTSFVTTDLLKVEVDPQRLLSLVWKC